MSILVLKLKGKGSGSADYVSVHTFDDVEQAHAFVVANTKPDQKYWEVSSIVDSGELVETYLEALL